MIGIAGLVTYVVYRRKKASVVIVIETPKQEVINVPKYPSRLPIEVIDVPK